MNFNIDKTEKYTVITINQPKLTAEMAPSFKTELISQAENKVSIICDMSSIDYIDSAGLSCFLIGERLMKESNHKFILCNVSSKTMNLIKLTKLDTILMVIPTLQEAKDYISLDELEKDL